MTTKSKRCPSCGNNVDFPQITCPSCGWQFSSATMPATRPAATGFAQTLARGLTRPNWICSNACQLAILVRDRSGSMRGKKASDASDASLNLIKVLADPSNKEGFFCAVVDFSGTAEVVVTATKATQLANRVPALRPGLLGGSTNVTDGLAKTDDIITAFAPSDGRRPLQPVVVLFSDGAHNQGPRPDAIASAIKTKADLICVAFGDDADENDLRQWASPNLFTRCATGADLRRFFAAVGATLQATRARGVNATQALANVSVP